jgi:hypothetical protein
MSTFPNGFAAGLVNQGMPILNTYPGRVFWLDSVNGSDGNRGTFARPFATLMGAQAQMMSSPPQVWNDVLMVKPGHYENITNATAFQITESGLTIVGLGVGADRPTWNFNTANTAVMNIVASNVVFQNCRFIASFLNVAAFFNVGGVTSSTGLWSGTASITGQTLTVTASSSGMLYPGSTLQSAGSGFVQSTKIIQQLSGTTGGIGIYTVNQTQTVASTTFTTVARGFGLVNCQVADTSATLNGLIVVQPSATSNACDGLSLIGNTITSLATTGVVNLVALTGTHDSVTIMNNNYIARTTNASAVIPATSGKYCTNFLMLNNRFNLVNAAATATGYLITSNTATWTGFVDGNIDHCLANTTYLSSLQITAGTGLVFGQNWHSRTADKSPGVVLPAADV